MLVLGDGGMGHALILVEDGVGQRDTFPAEFQSAVREHIALVTIAENVAQPIGFDIQRPMQVVRTAGQLGKLRVVARHEAGKKGVSGFPVGDAGQPQFLDQAVLQGAVGALDATFCLRGVGAQDLDVSSFKARPNWVIP